MSKKVKVRKCKKSEITLRVTGSAGKVRDISLFSSLDLDDELLDLYNDISDIIDSYSPKSRSSSRDKELFKAVLRNDPKLQSIYDMFHDSTADENNN